MMEELEVDLLLHQALDERDVMGVRGGRRVVIADAVEACESLVRKLVYQNVGQGEHLGDGIVEARPL